MTIERRLGLLIFAPMLFVAVLSAQHNRDTAGSGSQWTMHSAQQPANSQGDRGGRVWLLLNGVAKQGLK